MSDELKQAVVEVMNRALWCVIATVDGQSKPEAAIIGFSHNDELELIMGTSNKTRKYANLSANPRVAVVIGDDIAEVQYEGVVSELDIDAPDNDWLERHLQDVPSAKQFVDDPLQTWFKIKPTWLRLMSHENGNQVEEMTFS